MTLLIYRTFSSRELKSEYRVRYRPFSQYEYIDGRFIPGSSSQPNGGGQQEPGLEKKQEVVAKAVQVSEVDSGGAPQPWYKEVVELRKEACNYKCRGWGTDLASPQMSQLYQKQIELYEQTRKRESLSALSLAINSPRVDNADR